MSCFSFNNKNKSSSSSKGKDLKQMTISSNDNNSSSSGNNRSFDQMLLTRGASMRIDNRPSPSSPSLSSSSSRQQQLQQQQQQQQQLMPSSAQHVRHQMDRIVPSIASPFARGSQAYGSMPNMGRNNRMNQRSAYASPPPPPPPGHGSPGSSGRDQEVVVIDGDDDDEHNLVAHYARKLSASGATPLSSRKAYLQSHQSMSGRSSSTNGNNNKNCGIVDEKQRIISQLESRNREIMKEIEKMRRGEVSPHEIMIANRVMSNSNAIIGSNNRIRRIITTGANGDIMMNDSSSRNRMQLFSSSQVEDIDENEDMMCASELSALKERKEMLERKLISLRGSRNHLLMQLQGLMKQLKIHGQQVQMQMHKTTSAANNHANHHDKHSNSGSVVSPHSSSPTNRDEFVAQNQITTKAQINPLISMTSGSALTRIQNQSDILPKIPPHASQSSSTVAAKQANNCIQDINKISPSPVHLVSNKDMIMTTSNNKNSSSSSNSNNDTNNDTRAEASFYDEVTAELDFISKKFHPKSVSTPIQSSAAAATATAAAKAKPNSTKLPDHSSTPTAGNKDFHYYPHHHHSNQRSNAITTASYNNGFKDFDDQQQQQQQQQKQQQHPSERYHRKISNDFDEDELAIRMSMKNGSNGEQEMMDHSTATTTTASSSRFSSTSRSVYSCTDSSFQYDDDDNSSEDETDIYPETDDEEFYCTKWINRRQQQQQQQQLPAVNQ